MITIHLGVIDVPYGPPENPKKVGKKPAKSQPTRTTGDVAEILEAKYAVMKTFWEINDGNLGERLTDSVAATLENLMSGAPPTTDPFGSFTQDVEKRFHDFITYKVMDRLGTNPGVPTKAAMRGVSHRFKHPYARRPERPSFVDTGLYLKSFKAWVD